MLPITWLLERGTVVICAGGGIPAARRSSGSDIMEIVAGTAGTNLVPRGT